MCWFLYGLMLFETNIKDLLNLLPTYRIRQAKQDMRELLVQRRRLLTEEQIQEYSALVIEQLERMTCFRQAQTILLYYPIRNEVSLLPLFKKYKHEKTLLLPVTHRKYIDACPYQGNALMKRGKFNIPEPQTEPYKGPIDLILVPGVAFDKSGNRLGRGGGYYDKFLRSQHHAITIGVGYDFQLVEEVPVERNDIRVKRIILPSQTIEVKSV